MAGIAFLYLAGGHDWHSFPLLVQQCPQQLSHLDIDLYVGMHVPSIGHVAFHASDLVNHSACLAQVQLIQSS